MSQEYQSIRLETRGAIARLTLDRPEYLNALSRPMLAEIIAALDGVRAASSVRVLVIDGAGRGFCSGTDLAGATVKPGSPGYDAGDILEHYYNPIIERLSALPVPVLASVHGAVAGAGCMLALAADFVIAARSAYFMQAFIRTGLIPDSGSLWLLPRLIGRARAQAMMMLGEKIPADEALAWGLIYKVTDDDERQAATDALATRLATGPTRAYGLIRSGVLAASGMSLPQALALERESQRIAGATADFAEGVAAFREKRPPNFKGE